MHLVGQAIQWNTLQRTLNKGHLSIKDTCSHPMVILYCITYMRKPLKSEHHLKDNFSVPSGVCHTEHNWIVLVRIFIKNQIEISKGCSTIQHFVHVMVHHYDKQSVRVISTELHFQQFTFSFIKFLRMQVQDQPGLGDEEVWVPKLGLPG